MRVLQMTLIVISRVVVLGRQRTTKARRQNERPDPRGGPLKEDGLGGGSRPDARQQRRLASGGRQKLASPKTKQPANTNTRERLTVRSGTYSGRSHAEDLRSLDRVQQRLGCSVVHRSCGRDEL
jgi:hypothetical protein